MSNLRQAAQQALEALEIVARQPVGARVIEAITALRAALAEPEQNPFGDDAERYARKLHEEREAYKALFTKHKPEQEPDGISWLKRDSGYFTAPTPRKPLTNAEIDDLWLSPPEEVRNVRFRHTKFARAIEFAHGITGETE